MDGATLRLTWESALDAGSVPAAGDFEVKVDGTAVALAATDPVAVAGNTVTLTLASAVTAGQGVTVSYTRGANPVQVPWLGDPNRVADLTDEPVRNVTGDAAAPVLSGAAVEGATLTLTWDEELDPVSVPGRGAFTVKVGGTAVSLAGTDPVAVRGNTVILTLASAVSARQVVTVSYTKPTGATARPIRDYAGNAAASVSDQAVVNTTGTPVVIRVALVSEPSADVDGDATAETYAVGDVVRAQVTFSQPVDVVGSPELKLRMGGDTAGERSMAFDAAAGTSGTAGLEFTYTVAAGDLSAGGIGFAANALSVGAGVTVRKAGTEVDAELNFAAVEHDGGHRVDGVAPALGSATVAAAKLELTWDEALDGGSVPAATAFTVKADGSEVSLAASEPVAVAGAAVTLALAAAVSADAVVTVSYAAPDDDPLRDRAGNAAGGLTDQAVTNATPRPVLARATVGGSTLVLFYDRTLDTQSVPAAGDFTVDRGRQRPRRRRRGGQGQLTSS